MNKEKSRFTFPCVTIEQAAAFEYERRETWTASPLVNAVLDAARCVRPMNKKALAAFLGIDPKDVTYGIHAATGLQLPDFLEAWRIARFKHLLQTEPTLSGKEMANRLGYSSQGALWTFLTNHRLIAPLINDWGLKNKLWRLNHEPSSAVEKFKAQAKASKRAEENRRKWEFLTRKNKI